MPLLMLKPFLLDFRDSLEGLRRRPFRFLLSGMGIGIGVSALVAMLSIGEGAKQNALSKIESLGVNTLRVEAVETLQTRKEANLSKGLSLQDLEQIKLLVGSEGDVGGYLKKDEARISFKASSSATLLAVTPEWTGAEGVALASGRPLFAEDLKRQQQICLLGGSLARTIRAQVGSLVRIDNTLCSVVGVFIPKGRLLTEGTGLSALDYDNLAVVPFTNISSTRAGRDRLDGIVVALSTTEEAAILNTASQLNDLLKQRHRGVKDYLVVAPLNLLVEVRETQRTFSVVMGVIAGLSLLVGGIGVMNVMLANISEQTREIGLRMAVGATKQRIVNLYLWQSVQLTLLSGLWGVIGGVFISLIVQSYAGWPIAFSLVGLLMGPFSATLTGIIFGLHPAMRASSISPALALREA